MQTTQDILYDVFHQQVLPYHRAKVVNFSMKFWTFILRRI